MHLFTDTYFHFWWNYMFRKWYYFRYQVRYYSIHTIFFGRVCAKEWKLFQDAYGSTAAAVPLWIAVLLQGLVSRNWVNSMHFIASKYSYDQNYYVNTSTIFPSAYCILPLKKGTFLCKTYQFLLNNKLGIFWASFHFGCISAQNQSWKKRLPRLYLPIELSAAVAPFPWRWEGTPTIEPLPLLIRPWADSSCCSNSRTFFASHPTLISLWHFLWTSNLHCVHLNPWRPSPQIRSWQYAQKALWNEKEEENENESIPQRKNIGLDAGYTLFLLWQLNPAPVLFQICHNSDCRNT